METKILTRTLKALVTLAMIQSPIVPEAVAKGAKCEARSTCDKAYAGAQTQAELFSTQAGQHSTGGANGDASALINASQGTATVACGAQQTCEGLQEKCETNKKNKQGCTQEDCNAIAQTASKAAIDCAQANSTAAGAGKTQSAATGGGSGGQMMGMLAGAAMGALAAMAMQKKDKKDEPLPVDPNAAWNGVQLDCSKMDAFMYQACNSQMEAKCAPQMDEPTCVQFEARYCSGQGSATMAPPVMAAAPQVDPATGAIIGMPALGQPGEGVGTQFCANNTAYNFCKGAGRQDCPSCLRLQQNASAICAQNPSACMASNSTAEMQKAAQTCPTDPAFANPSWASGATTAPAVAGAATTYGAGGPAVILPQSASGQSQAVSSTGGPATNGNYGSLNGAVPASATGALQEGRAAGLAGANGGTGSAGGGSTFVPSAAGGSRELASGGAGFRPSSVGGAPSSEVQAQYSQSLFVTSSQVIRNRCNTGRLNCP